jgi:hypothetical protein
LSNEYPIALTLCDEQEVAIADSVKGDDTELPFTGVLTVTPASAGRAIATIDEERRVSFWAAFIEILYKWFCPVGLAILERIGRARQ